MKGRFSREFWLKLGLIGLFIFACYSNIQLIINNHQLGQLLTAKKAETAQETFDNQKLKLLIAYYQTPSYQEVEARRRLQLKKPGETVYAIKGLTDANLANAAGGLSDSLETDSTKPTPPTPKPNIQLWWAYFFN